MSIRTIIALIITIVLTVTIMQNNEIGDFTIFFIPVTVPKLAVLTAMSVSGFILGILVSRPRRVKHPVRDRYHDEDDDDVNDNRRNNTLSDEDRDYIS